MLPAIPIQLGPGESSCPAEPLPLAREPQAGASEGAGSPSGSDLRTPPPRFFVFTHFVL